VIASEEISETAQRIERYVRRTPVIDVCGAVLKLEFMQHAGSFKTRGAFANLLTRAIPAAGVVAASGGNHGAAVAYAAMRLGVPCKIYVPSVSSPAKIARIQSYGAQLAVGGDRYADAYEASLEYERDTGALAVHAFDSPETLRGQGTLGKELAEQAPLDTLLLPVGGGGLIAGVASWYAGNVKIVAVEPEGAPTLHAALKAGEPVDAPAGSIANDSLAPRRIGSLVFPIAQRFVERVVLVSDLDIREAQTALWEQARIFVEPGGAAAFAALHSAKFVPARGERVGVVLSGANLTR
jgi:threonine dehydratase